MTEFLSSLKADLLDRRLLPLVTLLAVGLVAAVAYVALGEAGSSGSPAIPTPVTGIGSSSTSGIVLTPSPANPAQAIAETTSGVFVQRGGPSRNPFTPLPGTPAATASAPAAKASSPASSHAGSSSTSTPPSTSSSSAQGAKGSSPASTPEPAELKPPPKPAPVYNVAVLFGVAPTGTPPQGPALTPYDNLKRFTPLPSAKNPLVSFMGVTDHGKSATFTLVGEAIIRGDGACVPSPSQCQAIDLKPKQAEQLEYLPPNGQPVTYELQVVSITEVKAGIATAKLASAGESVGGRELLRHAGRLTLAGTRYSAQKGVLVFTARVDIATPTRVVAGRPRHAR